MATFSDVISPEFVQAEFRRALEGDAGVSWVNEICTPVYSSSSASEKYVDLFDAPAMALDKGQTAVAELVAKELSLSNELYAAAMRMPDYIMRRDKTGQVVQRIQDLARRVNEHWAVLASAKLAAVATATDWIDSQYVVDTDKFRGGSAATGSGTLDNDISIDISALPASTAGSTTNPSDEEAALCLLRGVSQFETFKDSAGEPMMANAFQDESFLVMAHPTLAAHLRNGASVERLGAGRSNPMRGVDLQVVGNIRLSAFTSSFLVIRKRGMALIRQQELAPRMAHLGPGTTYFEQNKETHLFTARVDRAMGYGNCLDIVLVTMT